MKTKSKFTEVCHLDTCYPDYFTGYSYPVIAIAVYNGMTNHDLAEEIKSEINATLDYLTASFSESDIELFDKYCQELMSAEEEVIYKSEEEEEESDESVYMYFSLCKPVTRYGIKFLN